MNAEQIVENVEALGGTLFLAGERIRYALPPSAAALLKDIRVHKAGILALLRDRAPIPHMPDGVQLLHWAPKTPPILLTQCAVVINTQRFIETTLQELDSALQGKNWLAGNRSTRELVERLEQVGVHVAVNAQASKPELREDQCRRPK